MTTVLLADRDGRALGPLADKTVPALLPLRGAPILERALEALVAAGVRSALVVVGPRGSEIEKRFGKGIRWGIALEYVRRSEDETTGAVLRRLEHRLDGEMFVLRGDAAIEEAFGEFVRRSERSEAPVVAALSGERLLGMWRVRPEALKKLELPREPADEGWVREKGHDSLDVGLDLAPLDSLSRWSALDRGDGTVALSPRAVVSKSARLSGGATVAEEAAVLGKAALDGVSVLPRSVVPDGVSLRGAAVAQNLVVDPASGATSLLTDLLPPAGTPRGAGLGSRLAGLVLFLLSLPLWPVAFAWSFVANAGRATRPYSFAGNGATPGTRAAVKTFRFETAIPVFRDLPLLLAVLGGSLALAGVAPLVPEEEAAGAGAWAEARREAPVGLLARSRMVVPASAPGEVARVVDAFDARRGCRGLVPLGLSTFLSARAWTAPRSWNPDELPEAQG
ncbi:MAG: sugar phosphate nucleotidyltransferase [Thermoanaerobaculia bacterium]